MTKSKKIFIPIAVVIVVLASGTVFPFFLELYASVTDWSLTRPEPRFIGLANYESVFRSPDFQYGLLFTLLFATSAMALEIILGLAVATLFNRQFRGRTVLITGFLIPFLIPPIIGVIDWKMLLDPSSGWINYYLGLIGKPSAAWFFNASTGSLAILLVEVWGNTPFIFLILLASLQGIPTEPEEAARVDGGSRLQIFRFVTLPALKNALVISAVLGFMFALRVFTTIMTTTRGGPGSSTMALSVLMYYVMFPGTDVGKAAAIAVATLLVAAVAANIFLKYLRK